MGFFSSLAAVLLDPSGENRNRFKGATGEARAASGLLLFLPSEYRVINDLLLPTPKGTTQIDHVVVSNYGIFVIESKNISGAIYGSADDMNWTVCRGPTKLTIYNPIRQNAAHIAALAAAVQMSERFFHSLVYFLANDCRFAIPMPENVRQTGLCDYIKGKRRYLLPNSDVQIAIQAIESARLPTTKKNMESHVANLKQRLRPYRKP